MPAHDNEFRWNPYNRGQVEKHGLSVEEVEHVVRWAKHPYPQQHDRRGSWKVIGRTPANRRIMVCYFIGGDDRIFVYHAM